MGFFCGFVFQVGEVALLAFSPDDNGVGSDGRRVLSLTVDPGLVSLVRVLLATNMPVCGEGQSEDHALIPESVRAFAFVSLGKVCLVDQRLAKECVTLLVREIDHCAQEDAQDAAPSSPAVQSNALLVLGDLCVRYTALVERHLPAIARCLQSPHGLIRRHTLLLLSQARTHVCPFSFSFHLFITCLNFNFFSLLPSWDYVSFFYKTT
jgi:condensin-2 complex subunit D3